MTVPTFSKIEASYTFPSVTQSYAQSAIDHYALASLDMNPVHTNEEWAARAQVFGMPVTVGHGMMTMSSVRYVDAKFTKPVKVGETVTATGRVKQKHFHGPGKNWVQVVVEGKDSAGDLIGIAEVGYNLPD